MKKNNRKGFTIVELVIVIAVIGILAGIMIPTFSSVVDDANEKALASEIKNTYTLFLTEYAAKDFDDVLVEIDDEYYEVAKDGTFDINTPVDKDDTVKYCEITANGNKVLVPGCDFVAADATATPPVEGEDCDFCGKHN